MYKKKQLNVFPIYLHKMFIDNYMYIYMYVNIHKLLYYLYKEEISLRRLSYRNDTCYKMSYI